MNNITELNACGDAGFTDLPQPYVWLQIIVYPLLLTICTVGNLAVIVVLRREFKVNPTSTHVYLFAIAVADLLMMWQYVPMYPMVMTLLGPGLIPSVWYLSFIYVYTGISTCAATFLTGTSEWILVVFSIERLWAILSPLETRKHVGVKQAALAVIICIAINLIASIEVLASYYYSYVATNSASDLDSIIPVPAWLRNWEVVQSGFGITALIVRFFFIFLTNTLLILFLTQRRRKTQFSFTSSTETLHRTQPKQTPNLKEQKNSNALLHWSFFLYFLTHLPVLIFAMLKLAAAPPFCSFSFTGDTAVIFDAMGNLLTFCNASLTVIFYCFANRKFRQPFFCLHSKETVKVSLSKSRSTSGTVQQR